MPFDIVIGRAKKDVREYGTTGSILLGKQYVQMGAATSLSNKVYVDVAKSHVIFVVGKRGGGKSYTMGVIAEGVAQLPKTIKQNISVILLDTMGVYWTMKYPNHQDTELLKEWGLEAKPLDIKIFTPSKFFEDFKEKGIPTDAPFSIRPSDVTAEDWCKTFDLDINSPAGVLISRIIDKQKEKTYSLNELIETTKKDKQSDEHTQNIVINQFQKTNNWGIFSKEGTPLKDLAKNGQVTVLDMSVYATLPSGWLIKSLVIGLISKKLFIQRMIARKNEEFSNIDTAMHYLTKEKKEKLEQPLVWLVIDEAHEMLPNNGTTTATEPLVTILREGRQPGISLILASQQPGKIHSDVMTQSDIFISHRLTAQIDIEALNKLTQTYMQGSLGEALSAIPHIRGAAVVFDDINEKVFPIQVRPRITWHGGGAPTALTKPKTK